ncbi:MAG: cell division protein FtsH, partial [Desulfocurvibacter africanus]
DLPSNGSGGEPGTGTDFKTSQAKARQEDDRKYGDLDKAEKQVGKPGPSDASRRNQGQDEDEFLLHGEDDDKKIQ